MQAPTDHDHQDDSSVREIDFDKLMKLYQDDPEAFEQQRLAMIEETIAAAPEAHQRRMKGLQFQIDMERRRADTPLRACMRISSMMWEKFDAMRDELNALSNIENSVPTEASQQKARATKADVLEFQSR
ncbi:MAG: DUF3135 domain-containing protein [Pseudomonadota bacterium]